MDLFLPIVLFIVFCVLFSICGWCCKKHREGTVYGFGGNPAVTVTTQHASTVIPPYPVDPSHHPQPQAVPPGPGFAHVGGYQASPYPPTSSPYPPAPGGGYPPAAPYPVGGSSQYPPATPYPPTSAPYPAGGAPYPAQPLPQPPSYMEAVGQPPTEPHHTSEVYTKQSPYNPHY